MFQTMAYKLSNCTSEEQMYRQLQDFKSEFNTEYGKLSRKKRSKDGFEGEPEPSADKGGFATGGQKSIF